MAFYFKLRLILHVKIFLFLKFIKINYCNRKSKSFVEFASNRYPKFRTLMQHFSEIEY